MPPKPDDDRIEVYDTLAQARAQFGENFDSFVFPLTRTQVEALLADKVIAFDIRGREYAGFLTLVKDAPDDGK